MAYNTVPIKKDVDGKPIPQFYNEIANEYEVLKGQNGASRVILYDKDGNEVNLVALFTSIVNILTGTSTESKQDEIIVELQKPIKLDGSTMEYYGNSTDEKPTENIIVGSTYFEIDTVEVYMWDGTNWVVI
jgi:hypothetical protein